MSNDEWGTPKWLYDWANWVFGPFDLDAAASKDNSKCFYYWSKTENSLVQNWGEYLGDEIHKVWMNPPYSRGNLEAFTQKAVQECIIDHNVDLVCALLKDDRSTWWWRTWVKPYARVVQELPHRIRHIKPDGTRAKTPNFPSVIVVWYREPSDAPEIG